MGVSGGVSGGVPGGVSRAGRRIALDLKSCCDVKSLTYCDLQCVAIRGITDVLQIYPEFGERFARDLQHDLTYNLRAESFAGEPDDVSEGRGHRDCF